MRSRTKKSLTIKTEIFLLSFLFLAIVSLIFSGMFLKLLYDHNMISARNSLKQCNSQIVTFTEGIFHENASLVKLLAENPLVINRSEDRSVLLDLYDDIRKNNINITYVYSAYEDEELYVRDYDVEKDFAPTKRPWYQKAKNTDGVAQLAYKDEASNEWLFSQSIKLVDDEGRMTGVVCIDCSNENVFSRLSTTYQYDSQRSYILDADGTVLMHPEEQYINSSILDYMAPGEWTKVINGTNNYEEYTRDGLNSMVYFEWLPNSEIIVATAIDATEVTRPIIRGIEFMTGIVVCLSIGLGFILSRILTYRFARPIIALESRIRKVAKGCMNEGRDLNFSNVEINGIADSIEVIVKDIVKREEERKAAEYLSFHDSMTGVYNRRFFMEELGRLDKQENYPLCILCCDINCLKQINDVFGHDMGDELINKVADCLKRSCRSKDILARLGGDEFSIIMPNVTEANAQKICSSINRRFSFEKVCGVAVTVSLGYGIKEEEEEAIEYIMQAADEMMYAQKLRESAHIRQNMVESIIDAAKAEGIVKTLDDNEINVLSALADVFCPESKDLLIKSYELRNIGMCTIFKNGNSADISDKRHTETGYRILCVFDEYRSIAGCVLHYTEHWDASGWPVGLSGRDIPLMSRIIGITDAFFSMGQDLKTIENNGRWYDPDIVSVLCDIVKS